MPENPKPFYPRTPPPLSLAALAFLGPSLACPGVPPDPIARKDLRVCPTWPSALPNPSCPAGLPVATPLPTGPCP